MACACRFRAFGLGEFRFRALEAGLLLDASSTGTSFLGALSHAARVVVGEQELDGEGCSCFLFLAQIKRTPESSSLHKLARSTTSTLNNLAEFLLKYSRQKLATAWRFIS